jgi:hypothetical protein
MWLLPLAAALHVTEEALFGWLRWAAHFVPGVTLAQFAVFNALFLGYCVLALALPRPVMRFSVPCLLLINIPVHLVPTLRFRVYSPGLVTALGLYLPLSLLVILGALRYREITSRQLAWSALLGAGLMLVPFLFQWLRLHAGG